MDRREQACKHKTQNVANLKERKREEDVGKDRKTLVVGKTLKLVNKSGGEQSTALVLSCEC